MDREEMIRTHSPTPCMVMAVELIDRLGWFIGTPTDRRVLEAADELADAYYRWAIYGEDQYTPAIHKVQATVRERRVALNGTESTDA